MDLREYVEDSKEAWMWIYADEENAGVNMRQVVHLTCRTNESSTAVQVIATTTTDEVIILRTFGSGGSARDWLKGLLVALNSEELMLAMHEAEKGALAGVEQ